MAPRASNAQRRATAEAFHELGVKGRKTGVTLTDNGVRDEHGMQPLDDIFSSPEKESRNGAADDDDEEDDDDESEEEPMDIDETTGPAPSAFMNGTRFPPPRARSPPKTGMSSPARRAPGLNSSSPLRASNVVSGSPSGAKSVQRRLDFTNKPTLAKPNGTNKGKGKGKAAAAARPAVNGRRRSPSPEEEEEDDDDDDDDEEQPPQDESLAMLDGPDDSAVDDGEEPEQEPASEEAEDEEEEEEEKEPTPPPSAKKAKGGRGRPKKTAAPVEQEETVVQSIEEAEPVEDDKPRASKKRGRSSKNKPDQDMDDSENHPPSKKTKRSSPAVGDEEGGSSKDAAAPKRRGRKTKAAEALESTEASTTASTKAKKPAAPAKKRSRPSAGVGDTSVAEIPRGPPLPKSRGLMISRRETPGSGAGMFTTRSGRTSFQPLKFWKNEHVELDSDVTVEDGKNRILLPHIKEIVRYEDPEPDPKTGARRRGGGAGGKKASGRRRAANKAPEDDDDDNDDGLEPWEQDGEVITGEVVVWQPEHEFDPPGPDEQIEVASDEQIAVCARAIQTREIRNATFKFAKTLSTPFFGSGVVDLPPRSEKKPKNSRKMHMTFFVFSGRVQVTVADTVFSIGRGGMWFVPRGNYYSIENVGDKPSRVFFAQGCEISSGGGGDHSQLA